MPPFGGLAFPFQGGCLLSSALDRGNLSTDLGFFGTHCHLTIIK